MIRILTYTLIAIFVIGLIVYIKSSTKLSKRIFGTDKELKYFNYSEFDTVATTEPYLSRYLKNGKWYVRNSGREHMNMDTLRMLDQARDEIEKGWNRTHPKDKIVFKVNSG